jgi:hypothetical protein
LERKIEVRIKGAKQIAIGLVLVIPLLIFSTSTANSSSKVSKSELNSYLKKISKLASTEESILNRYGNVTGDNYSDDQTTFNELRSLLPVINKFIVKVEAIRPTNAKLYSVHKIYLSGWYKQAEAMSIFMSALQNGDYSKMAQGNRVLSQGRSKMIDYQAAIQALS